ncbi:MAG: S-layer homology domain-containing protein [Oscillospiraceae bacterium]|nr:S-layer homology domain-containing protein [Oscillospiraceae bacterium]
MPITVSYNYDLNPSVTVYRQEDYNLNETDSKNARSIVRQLSDATTGAYNYAYVTFSDTTATGGRLTAQNSYNYYIGNVPSNVSSYRTGLLSDIDFIPDSSSTATKAEFRFTLTTTYSNGTTYSTYSGLMTFNITGDSSDNGDITYTGELGKDVYFDLKDFEDFYYSKTRGTLSYVSFTLPSGGTLYADGGRLNSNNACYASPSRTQTDLAGVYFSPTGTTATRPSTVRVSFTAYGTRYTSGASGTVVINYLSGTAKDITYTPTGTTAISLRASDFTDAYRQAVGSTAPSGLTIQFQDVPTYGTLSYKDSSRTNSSTVTLRSGNVKNYKFTTRTSGTNQLGDVSYTPSGTRSDTISYIAYNGNTPQFTGKVVFNPATTSTTMYVTFTGTSPLSLSYQEFVKSNAVVMASCTGVRIDSAPVSGTLTYSGAAVTAGVTTIQPALLGNVSYRPSVSGNVHDKVNFTCLDASGGILARGQIDLIVTGSTGSVTFKDVPSTAWYANDLNILISRGIIQGRGDGKFDPTAELKVGEALKIFMLASGYPVQQETTGKNWAVNYKNLAVSNGWIRNDVDLDAKISRNDMAELAARSLGISSSSAASPWSDNANGYAVALYYTSPQILKGDETGTFRGGSTLRRQEICAIAARVISYKESQQSAQRPGWLS